LIVIEPDGTVYNFWQFNRTSATTATAVSYGEANVVTDTGWGKPGGAASAPLGAGTTAVGANLLDEVVVQAQTDTGAINHALGLYIGNDMLAPGYVAPAIGDDGTTRRAPLLEGELLAIPPGTPMPSGLSPLGQEVFTALQQYGGYITDRGGSVNSGVRFQQNAYDSTTMNAVSADMSTIFHLLKVVSGGSRTGAPTLTVASNSLYVSPHGSIPLGLGVSVPNAGDNVTVTISGLPKYETITDNLDSKTFSGSSVTLTAAEVNSGPGLSLSSSYGGNGHPTATLTVTATDTTTVVTSAAQTITVVDPPATTTGSGPASIAQNGPPATMTPSDQSLALLNQFSAAGLSGHEGVPIVANTQTENSSDSFLTVPHQA
jgi:hypothetical protein